MNYPVKNEIVQLIGQALGRINDAGAASIEAPENINVNAIAPGFFPSKMTAHLLDEQSAMAKTLPKRRLGTPEDAAGTSIYLCSRASAWMTGHTLVLDGGYIAVA